MVRVGFGCTADRRSGTSNLAEASKISRARRHAFLDLGHIAIDMPLRSFQTSKTNLIMERWWISAYSNIILYGLPRSTLSYSFISLLESPVSSFGKFEWLNPPASMLCQGSSGVCAVQQPPSLS